VWRNEIDELVDLLLASYSVSRDGEPKSFSRLFGKRTVEKEPFFRPDRMRVVERDGKLVACLHIHKREQYFRGRRLLMGGIGGVAAHPEHRRRGLVKMLLENATAYMAEQGYDLSILFGSTAIYGSSGWQVLDSFNLSVNCRIAPERGVTVRRAKREDIPLFARLYAKSCSARNGPVVRTPGHWTSWIGKLSDRRRSCTTYTVRRSSRTVGYFVLSKGTRVMEMVARDDCPGHLDTLVRAASQLGRDDNGELTFAFWLPELVDSLKRVSDPSDFFDSPKREAYMKQCWSYAGLCKLIGTGKGALRGIRSTEELIAFLRANDYLWWPRDGF